MAEFAQMLAAMMSEARTKRLVAVNDVMKEPDIFPPKKACEPLSAGISITCTAISIPMTH
ncbi:hypothetical protein [Pseudomonas sp. DWP3-1-2]|uniref:hypothetical protein n=1 Tax=Pseudomonas sp. DWP3-1-2 TaxID=2804645 RepID=UPI003CEC9104